jgi:flagellar biosynthetic protein FliR
MIAEVEIVKVFLLVAIRFSGLILTAPLLGSANFPIVAKVGLIGSFSFLVTPLIGELDHALPSDALSFGVMGIGELMIGLVIGLVMTLAFASIQVGGQLMDMQSGFGMMNVFNPAFETQFPIFGFFYFILAVLYLLIINGHHLMIFALAATFDTIPLGGLSPNVDLIGHMSTWGTLMFYDGLLIAAPVIAAMLLAYMTMGLMGRVVPQIHLFVIGFPLTIATALVIVALTAGVYISFIDGMFGRMFENVDTLVNGLHGGA